MWRAGRLETAQDEPVTADVGDNWQPYRPPDHHSTVGPTDAREVDAANPAALSAQEVSYQYAGRTERSLTEVSLHFVPGTWTILAGATGSGKSTLLKALCGLIPRHAKGQFEGRVLVGGLDTRVARQSDLARRVGLVLQSPDDQLVTTSVAAEIAFGLENLALSADQIEGCLRVEIARADLAGLEDEPPHRLSGGQRQRLLLAALLAMGPSVLLLDEPLSQLDPAAAGEHLSQLGVLRDRGMTIVMAEHRLEDLMRRADRLIILDRGRLAADVPTNDLAQAAEAAKTAGIELPDFPRLALALGVPEARTVDELIAGSGQSLRRWAAAPVRPSIERAQAADARTLVELSCVGFRFLEAAMPALANVNLTINAGERIAIVGPNGAGKSTLLGLLAGVFQPSTGNLVVHGAAERVACGLVMQNPDLTLFCSSVRGELCFAPRQRGLKKFECEEIAVRAARRMNVLEFWNDPPHSLSQGQRQRVAIAAVLAMDPLILALDEPTLGQDPAQIRNLIELLTTPGHADDRPETVVIATHDMRLASRVATRLLVMVAGEVIADVTPEDLNSNDALLAAARLRRSALWEFRRRTGLTGTTVEELVNQWRG